MRAIGSGGGFGIGDHSVDSCNLMDYMQVYSRLLNENTVVLLGLEVGNR